MIRFKDSATIDYSNVDYLFKKTTSQDSFWQAIPKGEPALHLSVEANNTYDLFLRYKFQTENLNHYTITVQPHWWQSGKFYLLLGLLTFISLPLLIFYFVKKETKKKLLKKENETRQAKLELKAIYAQLNPHFVFNALNSIQGLMNKSQISEANFYLTEFSSLLRESLKNSDKEMIPLSAEIKLLETYIKLEKLRFRFNYTFSIDNSLNTNDIEVPALLLQPIIENAIKHGVAHMHENGYININFYSNVKHLLVDIIDNGNGFNIDQPNTGFGVKLTKERIQLMNKSFKDEPIQLIFTSIANKGTRVHLIFENWL